MLSPDLRGLGRKGSPLFPGGGGSDLPTLSTANVLQRRK